MSAHREQGRRIASMRRRLKPKLRELAGRTGLDAPVSVWTRAPEAFMLTVPWRDA